MGRGGVGAPGQGYDAGSLLFFATSAAPVDARALAAPFLALERAGVLVTFARCAPQPPPPGGLLPRSSRRAGGPTPRVPVERPSRRTAPQPPPAPASANANGGGCG